MAGAEKVTGRGETRRALLLLLCLAAAALHGAVAAQDRVVLLVEHPQSLQILNRYQQAATAEERARLRPFAPLIVLKSQEMLPDGFTAAMQVSVGGEVFYLVKDLSSGLLVGAAQAGRIINVAHAVPLGDTVRTTAAIPAELADGGMRTIPAGTLVQRLFGPGKTYVRVLRGDGAYCWIAGSHTSLLRPYHAASAPMSSRPTAVEASVRVKLAETNTVLRKLYGLLNARTGENLPPPAWSMEPLPGALLCELSGSPGSAFAGSTRFLAKDIENSLLGTGCHVETAPGRITVLLP